MTTKKLVGANARVVQRFMQVTDKDKKEKLLELLKAYTQEVQTKTRKSLQRIMPTLPLICIVFQLMLRLRECSSSFALSGMPKLLQST